jgi:hypothetical protein
MGISFLIYTHSFTPTFPGKWLGRITRPWCTPKSLRAFNIEVSINFTYNSSKYLTQSRLPWKMAVRQWYTQDLSPAAPFRNVQVFNFTPYTGCLYWTLLSFTMSVDTKSTLGSSRKYGIWWNCDQIFGFNMAGNFLCSSWAQSGNSRKILLPRVKFN